MTLIHTGQALSAAGDSAWYVSNRQHQQEPWFGFTPFLTGIMQNVTIPLQLRVLLHLCMFYSTS